MDESPVAGHALCVNVRFSTMLHPLYCTIVRRLSALLTDSARRVERQLLGDSASRLNDRLEGALLSK